MAREESVELRALEYVDICRAESREFNQFAPLSDGELKAFLKDGELRLQEEQVGDGDFWFIIHNKAGKWEAWSENEDYEPRMGDEHDTLIEALNQVSLWS